MSWLRGTPEEWALCVHERDVDSGLGGQDLGAQKAAQPGGPGKACIPPTQALPWLPARLRGLLSLLQSWGAPPDLEIHEVLY